MMSSAVFRFYAELNDFLPSARRQVSFAQPFSAGTTVKHAVESLGVAHTEVDLILVNGEVVDFSYQLQDGDQVSVYPVFESLDITSLASLRARPLREPRFVLDAHLGRLAAYLRLMGFDTLYRRDYDDEELAQISAGEQRILLTRDRGLLKRSQVTHGYCVRNELPRKQVAEVMHRFDLYDQVKAFSRCMRCNGVLEPAQKSTVLHLLKPDTSHYFNEFSLCASCGQVYWKGSHYQHMQEFLQSLKNGNESGD